MHYACQTSEGPFCGDNNVGPHALPLCSPHWLRHPTRPASALLWESGQLALSPLLLTISWMCFLQQLAGCHQGPPSSFLRAHSLAPYSTGTANWGTSPLSMTLTRSVKADGNARSYFRWTMGHQRTKVARAEVIWPTRSSSMKIPFRTSSSEATAGTTDPSGGLGRLRFSGAEGCFSFKTLRVSPSWGAKPSAEASSLTAPSHRHRQIWPLLFSWRLHPPMDPIPRSRVTCTTGRSVFSKIWETRCLTRVERERLVSPHRTHLGTLYRNKWLIKIIKAYPKLAHYPYPRPPL